MRANTSNKNTQDVQNNEEVDSYLDYSAISGPVVHKSYHELTDVPVKESDVLDQLHANLNLLADLQNRLSFLMREVKYLMKV